MTASVQEQDFDVGAEYAALLAGNHADGAIATFVGVVRNRNVGQTVSGLYLEHYPAMTEKALDGIIEDARERWALGRIRVIHRVGQLSVGEQIVFVGVTSEHRGNAFAACEFIMDFLKTRAPIWKKEQTADGSHWVEARQSDEDKLTTW